MHGGWHHLRPVCLWWCRGGVAYLRAQGWDLSKKDKINLGRTELREKAGLYTCPPLQEGQEPFHCSLEVKEELIRVRMHAKHCLLHVSRSF